VVFRNPTNPFIRAGRCVAGLSGLSTVKTAGINILPAREQNSKQLDLGCWRRLICGRLDEMFRNDLFPWARLPFAATVLVNRFHSSIIDNDNHAGEFFAKQPYFLAVASSERFQIGHHDPAHTI
jgi:hypothetical protein